MPETELIADGCLQAGSGACWQHFSHVADVGVRGFGSTMEAAFEQAALAMTAVITDPDAIDAKETIGITCRAPHRELLLVDWLNAIVYEMATRKMVFGKFRVSVQGDTLQGSMGGEPIDVKRHAPAAEVKGATLSELQVAMDSKDLWRAQCIVDV
jgi:tRNA nucleotidyltransferase (CCA-adding enzyme)